MHVFLAHRRYPITLAIVVVLTLAASISFLNTRSTSVHAASLPIQQISSDPYTNSTSEHQTQVEPDTLSFGSTVVAAFQSGRFNTGGGSSGISWATSLNAGHTWKTGTLPGITIYNGGSYGRVSDSVVGYDLAHHTWIISSLAILTTTDVTNSTAVIVNRSTDGGLTWSNPVVVSASGPNDNFDKDWIVCDQHLQSPFYGRCYTEWDNNSQNGQIMMSYSNDGGLSWSAPKSPANQTFSALGGQPVVQPDGHVIVPIYGYDLTTGAEGLYSYTSTDGGASWTDPIKIAPSTYFFQSVAYRGGSLPSAEIDRSGKVYLVWAGCYFEPNCASDDIVLTTTTDGTTWTPLQRIPLDPIGSNIEHLTAGIAVDTATSGSHTRLAVTYYYFLPDAACTNATCQMYAGFASSVNAGKSWSRRQTLTGPMAVPWLAATSEGYMTGDYISTSIALGRAVVAVPVAQAPNGQQLNEAIYGGCLAVTGGSIPSETLASTPAIQAHTQGRVSSKNYHTAN